jgi:hypothetical protein
MYQKHVTGTWTDRHRGPKRWERWDLTACKECPTPTAIGEFSTPEGLREGTGELRKTTHYCEIDDCWMIAPTLDRLECCLGEDPLDVEAPTHFHDKIRAKILHLVLSEDGPDPDCEKCGGKSDFYDPIPAVDAECDCHRPGLTGEQAVEVLVDYCADLGLFSKGLWERIEYVDGDSLWIRKDDGTTVDLGASGAGMTSFNIKAIEDALGLTLELDCRAEGCEGGWITTRDLLLGEPGLKLKPCPTCHPLRGVG